MYNVNVLLHGARWYRTVGSAAGLFLVSERAARGMANEQTVTISSL